LRYGIHFLDLFKVHMLISNGYPNRKSLRVEMHQHEFCGIPGPKILAFGALPAA